MAKKLSAKKLLFLRTLLLLAIVIGLGLASCRKKLDALSQYHPSSPNKPDTLLLYNLLADTGNAYGPRGFEVEGYQLYLNDSLIPFTGANTHNQITFGLPSLITLPPGGGSFTFKVVRYLYNADTPVLKNPDPSRVLYQTTLQLPAASGTNGLVFYDDNGKYNSMLLQQEMADPGPPATGNFKVRVVNFGYDMTNTLISAGKKFDVSLQYSDSSGVPGFSDVPFGTAAGYQEVDYGTYQFLLYNKTSSSYFNSSGPLNDVQRVFNILLQIPGNYVPYNMLYPTLTYGPQLNGSTLQYGNIGSYPFAPGGCYTILVIGNIYAVSLDRSYGDGVLDNVGKVQVVNANPNQQNVDVSINNVSVGSLRFGQYTPPVTVPGGNVTINFSSGGTVLYRYTTQAYRLSNTSFYYLSDLKEVPFVLPVSNAIDSLDYTPPNPPYTPAILEQCHIGALNLSPDAGNVFFTVQNLPTDLESALTGDLGYRTLTGNNSWKNYDGTMPPIFFGLRLSTSRTDSLAAKLMNVIAPPFHAVPAPGTYTLVAAGLLLTDDTAKGMRIILVKHSNFTPLK